METLRKLSHSLNTNLRKILRGSANLLPTIKGFLISRNFSRLSQIPNHLLEILSAGIILTLPSFQAIGGKERDLEIINETDLEVVVPIDIKDIEDLLLRLPEAREEAIIEYLRVVVGIRESIEDPRQVPAAALPHHLADPRPPLTLSNQ